MDDRLGVPRRWQMSPTPAWVDLPEAALQASGAQGVVPHTAAAPAPAPASLGAPPSRRPAPPAASPPSEEGIPPGSIQFQNASLVDLLDIYASLADAQLELDDGVRASPALFSFTNTTPLSRSEAILLFEQVLEQQGRIAVRHTDPRHLQLLRIMVPSARQE